MPSPACRTSNLRSLTVTSAPAPTVSRTEEAPSVDVVRVPVQAPEQRVLTRPPGTTAAGCGCRWVVSRPHVPNVFRLLERYRDFD